MGLRKPDWLAELQGIVAVTLLVAVGIVVVNLVTLAGGGPVIAQVPADAVTGVAGAAEGLRDGAVVDGDVEVLIADPTPGQLLAYELTGLPTVAVVAAVLALLWSTLRHARREDPFTDGTVRRLRLIGWIALVGGVLAQLVKMIALLELASQVTANGDVSATLDLRPIALFLLVGFGFFAIAEILRRGLALRTELEAVI